MTVTSVPRSKAERLAELLPQCSVGTSKQTGQRFYVVPASNRLAAHWTATDGSGCTCRGYQYRGTCTHADAAKLLAERQSPTATPASSPRKSYADLFPPCHGCGDLADGRDGYCDRCASEREYRQRAAERAAR